MSTVGDAIGAAAVTKISAIETLDADQTAAMGPSLSALGEAIDQNLVRAPLPAYACVWSTADAISQTVAFNPFNDGVYTPLSLHLSTSVGVTFDSAAGTFTVDATGTYQLALTALLGVTLTGLVTTSVLVNSVVVYTKDPFVHASVDPVERTTLIQLPLIAGDVVTIQCINTSGVVARAGTALALSRIG